MGLVRGSDPGVFVVFSNNDAWDDTSYDVTPESRFFYPIAAFDFQVDREPFADTPEIQAIGARTSVQPGVETVRGTFTCLPRYGQWIFYSMLAATQAYKEIDNGGVYPSGGGASWPNYSLLSNSYSALNHGFWIRAHLESAQGANTVQEFRSCFITKMTWEQPGLGSPRVTFEFIGRTSVLAAGNVGGADTDPKTLHRGTNLPMKAKDLGRTNSRLKFWDSDGDAWVTLPGEVTGFTLTVDNKLEWPPHTVDYATTHFEKLGQETKKEITLDVQGQWAEHAITDEHPVIYFAENKKTGIDFIYQEEGGSANGELRFLMPTCVVTQAAYPIASTGVIEWTATLAALKYDGSATLVAPHLGATQSFDLDIQYWGDPDGLNSWDADLGLYASKLPHT